MISHMHLQFIFAKSSILYLQFTEHWLFALNFRTRKHVILARITSGCHDQTRIRSTTNQWKTLTESFILYVLLFGPFTSHYVPT